MVDDSNSYPTAPNPFVDNQEYDTGLSIWARIDHLPKTLENDQVGTDKVDLFDRINVGDTFRTTQSFVVTQGDIINRTNFKFATSDADHTTGNSKAMIYDQNLNLLATSFQTSIPDGIGDVNVTFRFTPNYIIPAGVTSISLGLMFDNTNDKIIFNTNSSTGETIFKDVKL